MTEGWTMLAAKIPAAMLEAVDCVAGDNRSAWIRQAIEEKLARDSRPQPKFAPKSALGRKLLALRRRHLDGGAPEMTIEEIREEVRRRRGGRSI